MLLSCSAAVVTTPACAEDVFLDTIVVTGHRNHDASLHTLHAEDMPPAAADTAQMISRLPGAAINNNGSLSGQVQYRGASGFRVGTRINHQSFHSGGPNLMDPPMHYAPPALVDTIEVYRGTADLAFGPSLVGGVNAELKSLPYAPTGDFDPGYDVTAIGRSADRSHALGAVFGIANDRLRAFGLVSTEAGHDKNIPHGEIANTHHDRDVFGLGVGARHVTGDWELELRRQETGPTGNPPFAMDIDYVETDFSRLAHEVTVAETTIRTSVARAAVDHGMSNSEHRPPPSQTMQYRYTSAQAETLTFALDLLTVAGSHEFGYGIDLERNDFDVRITNPRMSTFFVTPLPGIATNRTGAYLNFERPLGRGMASIGARIDRHKHDAGRASTGPGVPATANMLAMQFNSADRDWRDTTTDLLARYWRMADYGTWRASIARKHRAPTYLERYGWLPIAASAGLADGNNYVGDLGLKPEAALIAELGIDMAGGRWWLRPTVFYHSVDDYIQGAPYDDTPGVVSGPVEMVSGMNGDPTPLRFANVEARMYGLDADFGYQLAPRWRLDGVVSVVRAKRTDISDDLYRISPDKVTVGLTYDRSSWSLTLEGVAVAAQRRVSRTNDEQPTGGYGLLNLYAAWQPTGHLFVSAGIENLGNRTYADHLTGYNRVLDSDVGVGERIPGLGRNVFLRLSLTR